MKTTTEAMTLDEFLDEQRRNGCLKRKYSRVRDGFVHYCDKDGVEVDDWQTCLLCRGVEDGEVVMDDEL